MRFVFTFFAGYVAWLIGALCFLVYLVDAFAIAPYDTLIRTWELPLKLLLVLCIVLGITGWHLARDWPERYNRKAFILPLMMAALFLFCATHFSAVLSFENSKLTIYALPFFLMFLPLSTLPLARQWAELYKARNAEAYHAFVQNMLAEKLAGLVASHALTAEIEQRVLAHAKHDYLSAEKQYQFFMKYDENCAILHTQQ